MSKPYYWWIFVGLIILVVGGTLTYALSGKSPQPLPSSSPLIPTPSPSLTPLIIFTPSPSPRVEPTPSPIATLPDRVDWDVPFSSQAPLGIWDAVHEETCEEAALLNVVWYFQGKKGIKIDSYQNHIPPQQAEDVLQDIITWEKEQFGYFEDTNAEQTAQIAKEKLGLKNVGLLTDFDTERLKKLVAAGNLLVVPTAGRLLNNPHFKSPGPPYHVVVIRGYDTNGFITNDPGTRFGEMYHYSYETLLNAIHDWNGSQSTITSGRKVVIVIGKQ